MRHTARLPKLGDTVQDVVVLAWLVGEGQAVAEGQPVLSVETEKIETEVEAPVAGVLTEQLVAVDDEVETGSAIFVIEVPDP